MKLTRQVSEEVLMLHPATVLREIQRAVDEAQISAGPGGYRHDEITIAMHPDLALAIDLARPWQPELDPYMLFGYGVVLDTMVPERTFWVLAETELERQIRLGRLSGVTVPILYDRREVVSAPPPTPTLRGLLRHWEKRIVEGLDRRRRKA